MKSCIMFGHADCPDSMLPKIEEAKEKEGVHIENVAEN